MNKKTFALGALLITCSVSIAVWGYQYVQEKKKEQLSATFVGSLATPIKLEWQITPEQQIRRQVRAVLAEEQSLDLLQSHDTAEVMKAIWNNVGRSPELSPQSQNDVLSLQYHLAKVSFYANKLQYARPLEQKDVKNFVTAIADCTEKLDDVKGVLQFSKGIETQVTLKSGTRTMFESDLIKHVENTLELYKKTSDKVVIVSSKANDGGLSKTIPLSSTQSSDVKKIYDAFETLIKNEQQIIKELDRINALAGTGTLTERESDALRILAQQSIKALTYAYITVNQETASASGTDLVLIAGTAFGKAYQIAQGLIDIDSGFWKQTPHSEGLAQRLSSISALMQNPFDQFTIALIPHIDEFSKQAKEASNIRLVKAISDKPGLILWRANSASATPPPKFSHSTDAFNFLNWLSNASSESDKKLLLSEKFPLAFGKPIIENVRTSNAGGYEFDIISKSAMFKVTGYLPSTAQYPGLTSDSIQTSEPVVAFTLQDNALYLVGVALNTTKESEQRFIGKTNVKIPVVFTESEAQRWNVAYAEQQKKEQTEVEKKLVEANKLAVEQQKQYEMKLMQDPIYRTTKNIVSGMSKNGPCSVLANTMMTYASSTEMPDYVREAAIDKAYEKAQRYCM